MNKVILSGKILEIKYRLVDRGKVYGIAFVTIKEKENIILGAEEKIINLEYKIFRGFQIGDYILVEGKIMKSKTNLIVRVKEFQKIY